jgi:SNF2 family DNA or RNA helicase
MTLDFLEEGRSVAIFVNFTQTLEAIRHRLIDVVEFGVIAGGEQFVKHRQTYIDDFATDKVRIMLCNVAAGGVSVNLHDTRGKHPRVSIVSPSDNAMDILQCVGRIHRAGGATPSQQHILFAANTIEEEVKANCDSKTKNIYTFNEGI